MNSRFNKVIIISLAIALINLFALGCFFVEQGLERHHQGETSSMECCGIGDYQFSGHAGYNLQYSLSAVNYGFINLFTFFVLLVCLFLFKAEFFNYYLIKDRYGGFRLFYKFILLFRKGIIHPKIY